MYACALTESPEKIAVLIRVPSALLKGKVLPSADAVPKMEAICAQALESDSTSSSSVSSSMQPAVSGQQPVGNGGAEVPNSFSPVQRPGSPSHLQPLSADFNMSKLAAVQLLPKPPADVASQRREQLAELLLTHPNGDLRDFGLLLVGEEAKLEVLIRVPWPVLQWCLEQENAAELLDEAAQHAGEASLPLCRKARIRPLRRKQAAESYLCTS
jgi:hypothetical protein